MCSAQCANCECFSNDTKYSRNLYQGMYRLELLFLNNFAPSHPKLWYNNIRELSLPFPVKLPSYSYENNLDILWCLEYTTLEK